MGYRIGRAVEKSDPLDTETYKGEFFKTAFVRFDEIYIQEDFVPETVIDTLWQVCLDPNGGFYIEPTKETREKLELREITVSFWQGCVQQRIKESLDLQVSFRLTDENGGELWMFDDSEEEPWNCPAPIGTVAPAI